MENELNPQIIWKGAHNLSSSRFCLFPEANPPLDFFYTYQDMITKGSFTKSFPNRQQLKIFWVRGSPLDFYLWFRVSRIQFPHTNLCLWLRTKSKADFYLNRRLTCTLFSNVCVVRNFHWERQKNDRLCKPTKFQYTTACVHRMVGFSDWN